MNPYLRNQARNLEARLKQFPAVALIGARQVGKTTLAKQCRPGWRYIDLENPNDYELLTRDPMLFFQQFDGNIIIDEAQIYPDIFNVLRGVIDNDRKRKGRFILTGSSSPELKEHISESLAGRLATLEVGTLKANEFYQKPLSDFYKIFNGKLDRANFVSGLSPLTPDQMQHVWLKGGYPEPLLEDSDDYFQHWMENYYFNYINRDVARLFPKLNKVKYQQFLKILSSLSSTVINKSNLARALEISEGSARDYLKIADGTFLWRDLQSFESNVIKTIVKMPKGYIRDSGLLHYLLNIRTKEDLYYSPQVGHSFEGFVIEEILKGLAATGETNWQASYYRTKKGLEVDLLLEGYFGVLPIEVKYSSSITDQHIKNLKHFLLAHDLPFGVIVNPSSEVVWLTDNIVQIPVGWL